MAQARAGVGSAALPSPPLPPLGAQGRPCSLPWDSPIGPSHCENHGAARGKGTSPALLSRPEVSVFR